MTLNKKNDILNWRGLSAPKITCTLINSDPVYMDDEPVYVPKPQKQVRLPGVKLLQELNKKNTKSKGSRFINMKQIESEINKIIHTF